jgi:hypothetical protein
MIIRLLILSNDSFFSGKLGSDVKIKIKFYAWLFDILYMQADPS